MNELLRPDNAFNVVLILDECDRNHRADIWNKFKYAGSRIKIVTIYNEFDRATGSIRYFDVPPLGSGEISRIIQSQTPPACGWLDEWGRLKGDHPVELVP
jgi:hypothetical protein